MRQEVHSFDATLHYVVRLGDGVTRKRGRGSLQSSQAGGLEDEGNQGRMGQAYRGALEDQLRLVSTTQLQDK